jgi:hypothetical protein
VCTVHQLGGIRHDAMPFGIIYAQAVSFLQQ